MAVGVHGQGLLMQNQGHERSESGEVGRGAARGLGLGLRVGD